MRTDDVTTLIKQVSAEVILPRFGTLAEAEIEQKRPGDLVTVADREAELALAAVLRDAHPNALVVGEEAVFTDPTLLAGLPTAEHAWVIDPVDGTKNFARALPEFGVILAEVRSGVTVRGWIWQPVRELLFVAELGSGVTRNGVALAPLSERERPYRAALPKRFRREPALGLELTHSRGSTAIDYPGVLMGTFDAVGYTTSNPWDHLAGALMVTELGGFVGDEAGREYRLGGPTPRLLLAAASAGVHALVRARAQAS